MRFTGKERDAETGLDYFGARYMSAAQGRFGSADPQEPSRRHVLNPQKWNKYVYVINNPLGSIDPDGLEEIKITVATRIPWKSTWMFGTYEGGQKTSVTMTVDTKYGGTQSPVKLTQTTHATNLLNKDGTVQASKTAPDTARIEGWVRKDNGRLSFSYNQDAKNPLAPVPQIFTPGVFADLTFEVDDEATEISVQGVTSQYPSFSIPVTKENGQTFQVYQRDPWFNNTALLFFQHWINVKTSIAKAPKGCVGTPGSDPVCEP